MKTLIIILCVACVCSRAAIPLTDTFTYPDGSLTNVSNIKWRNAGGVLNEVNVSSGEVQLTGAETEDVDALLSGGPFAAAGSTVLYARFRMTFSTLPTGSQGDYFAHFVGSSANRGRIFATTNGAATGKFRLGISAGSSVATNKFPLDLVLGQNYAIYMRYIVSNAQCTLWINPTAESDPSVTTADTATAQSISAFAWRQANAIGSLAVDDLVVATSFIEAFSNNESPSISNIPDQQVAVGDTGSSQNFTVGDAETAANFLSVTVSVSDSNLVSAVLSGGGSNRTVQITGGDQTGTATVTVFVTDGVTTNSDSFLVTVVPALLFADDFNYPNGSLITNATPPWAHHSGTTTGQVQVTGAKLVLSAAFTEDVNVNLPGGPYTTNFTTYLYASFLVNFSALPTSGGDYFAHFNTTGARCRIFANTNNAGPGTFRLGLLDSGQTVPVQLATNLSTNTNHRVVVRYGPRDQRARLAVNPASESELDFSLGLTDSATAVAINAFAFREDPGIGTFTVDDLRLGLTFAAVTAAAGPSLRLEQLTSGRARLAWPATATNFSLQSNTNLAATNWQDVVATPVVTGSENMVTNTPSSSPIFFRLKK